MRLFVHKSKMNNTMEKMWQKNYFPRLFSRREKFKHRQKRKIKEKIFCVVLRNQTKFQYFHGVFFISKILIHLSRFMKDSYRNMRK